MGSDALPIKRVLDREIRLLGVPKERVDGHIDGPLTIALFGDVGRELRERDGLFEDKRQVTQKKNCKYRYGRDGRYNSFRVRDEVDEEDDKKGDKDDGSRDGEQGLGET